MGRGSGDMELQTDGNKAIGAEESGGENVEVINVWSGPRSLSTSLMYSFAQVFSEPEILHCIAKKRGVRARCYCECSLAST